jgi:putative transposase
MTGELNEQGLRLGQRRVGRLMRQNGIRVVRGWPGSSAPRNLSVTNSVQWTEFGENDHSFTIAPNLLRARPFR